MPASPLSLRFDRMLRVFADVRPGEGLTAVLLAANVFLILLAYYVLKPVREALILGQESPEMKSYLSVGQVALLLIVVPLYARLVSAVPRLRLIRIVTWVFIACLVAFYVLAQAGVTLGIAYFLWIGVFNLMIVAQFWAFANDIYSKDMGERLFPIVGFGASLGAVLGSFVAGALIGPLGVYQLMLVGAVGLLLQLQLTAYVDRREARRRRLQPAVKLESDQPLESHNAYTLVFNNRYLLLIGVMLLVFYLVDATGEYILGSIVKERATEMVGAGQSDGLTVEGLIARFYSRYFGLINIASLLIQLFLVSRLVKYLGVGTSVCILPALSMLSYSTMAFVPNLSFTLAGKVSEKSTDYSLNSTVRNMLFLPCTREEKVQRQAGDRLAVRALRGRGLGVARVRRHHRARIDRHRLCHGQHRAGRGWTDGGVRGGSPVYETVDRPGRDETGRRIVAMRSAAAFTALLTVLLVGLAATPAHAQKTDVIAFRNGDRLTCEIKGLDKGRIEVDTDDAGKMAIEWDKLNRVTTKRLFEVETTLGEIFVGVDHLAGGHAADRHRQPRWRDHPRFHRRRPHLANRQVVRAPHRRRVQPRFQLHRVERGRAVDRQRERHLPQAQVRGDHDAQFLRDPPA